MSSPPKTAKTTKAAKATTATKAATPKDTTTTKTATPKATAIPKAKRTTKAPRRSFNTPINRMEWLFSVGIVAIVGSGISLNLSDAFTSPSAPKTPVAEVATQNPTTDGATQESSPLPASSGDPTPGRVSPPVLGNKADGPTRDAVIQALDPILATFPDQGTGVALLDPSGEVVVSKGADTPLLPASTIKVATGTALWNVFGPDHRFETTFVTQHPPGPDGIINGDLYVLGDGDPTWMSELSVDWKVRPPRPTLSTGDIANELIEAGIKGITGSIVGVDPIFTGEATAPGWKPSYLPEQNATRIYALSVDRGLVFAPKSKEGVNLQDGALIYHTRQVDGPKAQEGYALSTSLDTRKDTAAALTQSLLARNVPVAGPPASAEAAPADAQQVASVPSLPLRQMVDWIELRSDNHMADMLVRRLDVHLGGDGSFVSAGQHVIDHVEALGVDSAGMVMKDGSGLSRDDHISAAQLAAILLHMGYSDPDWLGSLSLMGETGTTSNRLKNTAAHGRWMGKTGSLDDVVSYAGAIKDRQGGLWTIALLANGKAAGGQAYTLHDQILTTLATVLEPPAQFSSPKGM